MSLHGAYDPDNIFAKILRGDMPSVKVWEDDDVLAFMDVFPQSEGHVLVVSKTSTARNILEIEPETLAKLTSAVQRTARAVEKALKPEGLSLMQFNGDAGGQTVFHLHFHIVPRWTDRPMKGHGHAPMADAEQLKALAQKIAAALD
ncbi:HIT family protein [Brevundimonas diminuta]|jgi:histidine triad (HIT) family protein|uniref:HIT family protein n=1 Tax=Brevundimonas diminuta TaxID=293 RepID=A0A3D4DD48_BREDI|nr:HIT family protein [Brevundimonas diminuta]MBD3572952.1 HIT family protein [Brevundimonas diminuta]MBI2249744.1 HIT family protein [Brevundimonas diminuta]QAT14552.1 HIT family protein [Brevundimonas diminuta]QQB88068.1 HIT family protein [Brevundimonas diminuta]GEC00432.1 hydrolase [Brevundimonas diminuta]